MSDRDDLRAQLAAYLVGDMDDAERSEFENVLRGDAELERELRELGDTVALLAESEPIAEPPAGLADRIHEAVAAEIDAEASMNGAGPADDVALAADTGPTPARVPKRSWWQLQWPRFAAVGALALAIVAVVVVGGRLIGPEGDLEVSGDLEARNGDVVASVDVREIGIGRTVDISSDSLPILPKGEFYEVWFVGPGDSPQSPNRISAGTFHPDADGNSDVQLKAAVNPALFPLIEVTSEPGDGNPQASGKVVAKLDSKG